MTDQNKAKVQPGELMSLLGCLQKQKLLKAESPVASPKACPVGEGTGKLEPWSSLQEVHTVCWPHKRVTSRKLS